MEVATALFSSHFTKGPVANLAHIVERHGRRGGPQEKAGDHVIALLAKVKNQSERNQRGTAQTAPASGAAAASGGWGWGWAWERGAQRSEDKQTRAFMYTHILRGKLHRKLWPGVGRRHRVHPYTHVLCFEHAGGGRASTTSRSQP